MNKYFYIFAFLCLINFSSYTQEKWKIFGELITSRHTSEAIILNNDSIIIVGGRNVNSGVTQILKSCEIIDIKKRTVYPGPNMNVARSDFIILKTIDSNFIAIGGFCDNSITCTNSIEMLDKKTLKWTEIGKMLNTRMTFAAQFINDSEILIAGGRTAGGSVSLKDAEIFNVKTGQSRNIANYPYYFVDGMSAITSKGDVVFFGGREGNETSPHFNEIYKFNKITEQFEILDYLDDKVQHSCVVKLRDNRVLVCSGSKFESPIDLSKNITIETKNDFKKVGQLPIGLIWNQVELYNNDTIIVVGGYDNNNQALTNCYFFDFSTNQVSNAPTLNYARSRLKVVSIPQYSNYPSVLAISGIDNNYNTISSIEILEPEGYLPPQILSKSIECSDYYINCSDENYISSVEFIENDNCTMTITENLPSKNVHIKISLINKNKKGYFKLNIVSKKTGKNIIIIDSIDFLTSQIILKNYSNRFVQFDTTDTDSPKCLTLTFENISNTQLTISSQDFFQNINFYFPANQFPLIIDAHSSKDLFVCFQPKSEGKHNDTIYIKDKCLDYIVLFEGVGKISKPPQILETKKDCKEYYIYAYDENYIDIINFIENDNCLLTVKENLPSKEVHIILSLANYSKKGYFKLNIFSSKTGKSVNISDIIEEPKSQIIIKNFPSNLIIFDSISNKQILDTTIIIENITNQKIQINNLKLANNTSFSIPQNQFPFFIEPNSSKELKVCFSPLEMGKLYDTLIIDDNCSGFNLLLEGWGNENIYISESNCNVKLELKTIKYPSEYYFISNPYPNPTKSFFYLNIYTNYKKSNETFQIELFDLQGNNQKIKYDITKQNHDNFEYIYQYSISIPDLITGYYLISINNNIKRFIYPIFILK